MPQRNLPAVVLIEASNGARDLVAAYLEDSGDIDVVGAFPDLAVASATIERDRPDVVVIDRLPAPKLPPDDEGPAVVLYATTVPQLPAVELRRAGVSIVVYKEVRRLDELVAAVRRTAAVDRRRPTQPSTITQPDRPGPAT